MTVSQKVVLRGTSDDPDDEIELGPFSQGLIVTHNSIKDVTSGDKVAWYMRRVGWIKSDDDAARTVYRHVFIQTYPSDSPAHPPGGPVRSLMAQVEGRPIEVHLTVAHERRLRLHMEDVDAQERKSASGEQYERGESGAFTDATIRVAIRTAIEHGLEALEGERGVITRHDGAVFPTEETTDPLREALKEIAARPGLAAFWDGKTAIWAIERAREALAEVDS